jgi:uncharacterized protein YcaQ
LTTLAELRAFAIARSLGRKATLEGAIDRLGFVQADPIRAPARAQDLILRHRVTDYRAGDLERLYADLSIEEDHFVNYGFMPRRHLALMHPRKPHRPWDRTTRNRAARVVEFVRDKGSVHPGEVDARFAHGTVTNYWGGRSNATTHLLEGMHYRGMLRVARRESGVKIYAIPRPLPPADGDPACLADKLLALAVAKYAPLDSTGLGRLTGDLLRRAAPQLAAELRASLKHLRARPRARVDGVDWYWPEGEDPRSPEADERVLLLAPFDPIVFDRRRFEQFWGWAYRFEAYTPEKKRKLGYYAMPLLWRTNVIGWANVASDGGAEIGYVAGRAPRERAFARELEAELARMRFFLSG